jgi:ECF sigma factor
MAESSLFFGMRARIMKQILVDHARARGFQKRGGDARKISLSEAALEAECKGSQLVSLDDALTLTANRISKGFTATVRIR